MPLPKPPVNVCPLCVLEPLESRLLLSGDGLPAAELLDPAPDGELHLGYLAAPPPGYTYAPPEQPPTAYNLLSSVPEYFWHHGCGPTAAAMVLGYWDMVAYPAYYPGDASTQTTAVNEMIASKGDGSDTTADPGTPGTGHVPDYAYYGGVDDYGWDPPYADMSEVNPAGAHPFDCIADFLHTSRSSAGQSHGSTSFPSMASGLNNFCDHRGYSAAHAWNVEYDDLSWYDFLDEIDAGRPLVLIVDTDGNGETDHYVPAIGYRTSPAWQYACYTTWSGDPGVHWFDWREVDDGNTWGIHGATLLHPSRSQADLAGTAFDVHPEPLTWGASFTADYSVTNFASTNAGNAGDFYVSFFLSSNGTISTGDTWLGSDYITFLGDGDTHSDSVSLTLPESPPDGFTESDNVWIGMIVDRHEDVDEGVESNNRNLGLLRDTDEVTIDSRADLYGTNFELPMPIFNFGATDANFTIHNGGATAAEDDFVVEFYLSEDATIDPGDNYLKYLEVPPIAAGADYSASTTLFLPMTDPFGGDGRYYVGMIIDRYDAVDEGDETNNASEGLGLDYDVGTYGVPIFFADFDHGDGAMTIDNDPGWASNPGLWHVTSHRSSGSGTRSMYYGRELDWDYSGGHSAGLFVTKRIELPDEPTGFSCQYWAETEDSTIRDIFKVQVHDVAADTYDDLLVSSFDMDYDTGGSWKSVNADLTDYAGKQIRLRFTFDTINAWFNDYEGVYFDEIAVYAASNPLTVEGWRNLKYDGDLRHICWMHWPGDHDTLVFNEEQDGGFFQVATESVVSPVNGALAVYDHATGEMLYIDDDSGPDNRARVTLSNPGKWNSYMVEVWDTEDNSTGRLDVLINGSRTFDPSTIALDDDGDGSKTGITVNPATDTDFYRVTAPPQASGTLDIDTRIVSGALTPRFQVWADDGDDIPELVTTLGSGQITGVAPGDVFDISISDNDFRHTGTLDLLVNFSTSLPGTMTTAEGFCYFHNDGVSRDTHASASYIADNDVDSFYFAGDVGWTGDYTIRVDALTGTVDPVAAVYDATSGEQIAFDDDSGGGTSAELTLSLAEFTRYIVAVADDNRTDTGTVAITITAPDDRTPTPISTDADGNGERVGVDNIQANDSDFFRFTSPATAANGELEVTVSPEGSLDAAAILFDAAGNELGRAYVAGAGDDEVITVSGLSPSTTYYLTVCARNYATTGDFDVYVDFGVSLPATMNSAEGFAYFHNDGVSHDTQTFSDKVGEAYINIAGEIDSFYFAGDQGWTGDYTVRVNALGGSVDPVVAVYDATSGARLGFDDDSGGGTSAELTLSLSEITRYIVAVADATSTNTGDVEIIITAPQGSTTVNIPIDDTGRGYISSVSGIGFRDTDFARFTSPAASDGRLKVTVSPAVTLDVAAALFDAAGNEIAVSYLEGAGTEQTIQVTGLSPATTYYLTILARDYATTGSFDVEVNFNLLLRVTDSSVADGGVYSMDDPLTCAIQFNKPVNEAKLDVNDFALVGAFSGAHAPGKWDYEAATKTLTAEYAPLPWDKYVFTVFDSVTDTSGSALDGNEDGKPGGDFSVRFRTAIPGDTDLDGDVDFEDYIKTKGNFGMMTGATWGDGDSDHDGDVDFTDYITTKGNFGRSVKGAAEPLDAAPPGAASAGDPLAAISPSAGQADPAGPSEAPSAPEPIAPAATIPQLRLRPARRDPRAALLPATVAEDDQAGVRRPAAKGAVAQVGEELLDALALSPLMPLGTTG